MAAGKLPTESDGAVGADASRFAGKKSHAAYAVNEASAKQASIPTPDIGTQQGEFAAGGFLKDVAVRYYVSSFEFFGGMNAVYIGGMAIGGGVAGATVGGIATVAVGLYLIPDGITRAVTGDGISERIYRYVTDKK